MKKVSQENWNSFVATFKQTNYSDRNIYGALNTHHRENTPREEATLMAFLPFEGLTCNCISRVLTRHNNKTVGLLSRKVTSFLQSRDMDCIDLGSYRDSAPSQ
jgi:hypothetical protein